MEVFMKKLSVLIVVLLAVALSGNVFGQTFKAGAMLPSVALKFGGLGLGYGVGFEYGITDKIGAKASFELSSYESGFQEWSLTPIDIVGTYQWDDTKYGLLGATLTTFSVSGTGIEDESASSFGLVVGGGYRYDISGKLSANFEGRYRLISLESDSYKLTVAWYTIGVDLVYAL